MAKRTQSRRQKERTSVSTFRGHFDGKVIVPDSPVVLPVDESLEISAKPVKKSEKHETPLQRLAKLASQFPANPELPVDGAEQHDHYLYGTPKRS